MRIAIIGRSEILYDTALRLRDDGYEVGLILTAKEAPEYEISAADFKALAKAWDIPFLHAPKIEEDLIAGISELPQFDIGVSYNYTGIIPQSFIDLFRLGVLNAHGGDLPRYRGNACQAWAILNGEENIGLCIHRMRGGEIDSGEILGRDYYPVSLDTKIGDVFKWMRQSIPSLYVDVLSILKRAPDYFLEQQPADPKIALRCYPRRPEDGRIDWKCSAEQIVRLINASGKPFPGAFCEFEDERMIIWDAVLAEDENYLAVPGQVTSVADGYIEVASANGKIRITLIEYSEEVVTPDKVVSTIRKRLD